MVALGSSIPLRFLEATIGIESDYSFLVKVPLN